MRVSISALSLLHISFELVGKDFLKEDIRGSEIPEDTLKACLKADIDFIVLYIGMNR